MSQAAKAQEPSMEEILASIRRIIADDEAVKPAAKPAEPAPKPAAVASAAAGDAGSASGMSQDDIDAMLAGFDVPADEPASEAAFAAALEPRDEPEPSDESEPERSADVLDLTPAMEAKAPAFRKIEPGLDVYFGETRPEPTPAPQPAAAAPPPRVAEPMPEAPPAPALLSEHATMAASSAFSSLAHTVLMQNARTLDDLVREMLRPMLKNWLDDNLPTIVERLVRAEIERVSRGRG